MAGEFTLDGLTFRGINGGPADFGFTEAISFSVACRDQSEVDYYWDALVDGGEESVCGWLKDRFGLSWQIVPTRLYELVSDPDPARAQAATQAMLGMRRIVIDAPRGGCRRGVGRVTPGDAAHSAHRADPGLASSLSIQERGPSPMGRESRGDGARR